MKKLLVFSLMLLMMACNSDEKDEVSPNSKYIGEWESVSSEDLGNGTFATREFNLEKENWSLVFTLFMDEAQTTPVFAFRAVGKYEVEGVSTVVEGADNAYFGFDKKYVTLLTDNEDLINGFGFSACGLEKDVEKDISQDGCSFLVSNAECGQEYDLLRLDNGQLFFGARPEAGEDMCSEEKRPTTLFYPLKKK